MIQRLVAAATLPILGLIALLTRGRRRALLVWGPVPIINNKYWSEAMREAGHESVTLVREYFSSINEREDFNLYYEDLVPRWMPEATRAALAPYAAAAFVLRRAHVLHMPFSGGPLGGTPLWRLEAYLLKLAGAKTVLIPYGADLFIERRLLSESLRIALARMRTPNPLEEAAREQVVDYWQKRADVIVAGFAFDGLTRIDAPVGNMIGVDVSTWQTPVRKAGADGRNGVVTVFHAPNHRGAKGTEEIEAAVAQLRREGLNIVVVPETRVPNREIRELLARADIHADQIIGPGYGLAAIEGMAMALPVICNLDDAVYTDLLREHSFLAECPIVSATPQTITAVLRVLASNPDLRLALGAAGRQYVERYHSYDAVRYVFESIYARLRGEPVDLKRLFDPAASGRARRRPIEHPLENHHLPVRYSP
ncbi:MAG TPA: hypothetical protein VGO31_05310 [Microbacteriaceae bacterium]|jgi:glycosyltransferase involved in cell wall biosynthesis|nr:hypothetical protein [Microbacteriaceae bacterium]